LRPALSAAPAAFSLAFGLDVTVIALAMVLAPHAAVAGAALSGVASIITLVVALGMRSERAFLASVLFLAVACAVADLPVHRSGSAAFAAVAGVAVLAFTEAGGAALEPAGGGKRIGTPGRRHVVWVGLVAAGGGSTGWLLLALQPALSGYGLAALGVGVLAAICVLALAATLSRAAVSERAAASERAAGRDEERLSR
jgi:hypothetical protein